jgi:hypothetical protein
LSGSNATAGTAIVLSPSGAIDHLVLSNGTTLYFAYAPGSSGAAPSLWLCAVDPMSQAISPGSSLDYMQLFSDSAAWASTIGKVSVLKIYKQFLYAPDSTLRTVFQFLNDHHIALALEAPILTAVPGGPGYADEGYGGPGEVGALVAKVKLLGGNLQYVAMDEPLYYGHLWNGGNAAHATIDSLAQQAASTVAAIQKSFPNVQFGDIEPVGGVPTDATGASWTAQIAAWLQAFRSATGQPLQFFDADVMWSNPSWLSDLENLAATLQKQSTRFGVIVDGPGATSNVGWTNAALGNYLQVVAAPLLSLADIVIQTWNPYPTALLPETTPGTLTNLVGSIAAVSAQLPTASVSVQTGLSGQFSEADWSNGKKVVVSQGRLLLENAAGAADVTLEMAAFAQSRYNGDALTLGGPAGSLTIRPDGGPAPDGWELDLAPAPGRPLQLATAPISTITLSGGGSFGLAGVRNVQSILAQEGQAASGPAIAGTRQWVYLPSTGAAALTVAAASPNPANPNKAGIVIVGGSADSSTITLGPGADDVVYVGNPGETVLGGSGGDTFYVTSRTIGATIAAGPAGGTLGVQGGGTAVMGPNLTGLSLVALMDPGPGVGTQLTANATRNLLIRGGAGPDTVVVGDASQTIVAGAGALLVQASAATAGALVRGNGKTTLEITTPGTVALNPLDTGLTVQLDQAGTVRLNTAAPLRAIGSASGDMMFAYAPGQVLTGGLGSDRLVDAARGGVIFRDTQAGLSDDTIVGLGKSDTIDLTDLAFGTASASLAGGALSVLSGGRVCCAIALSQPSSLGAPQLCADGSGGTTIAFR